ELALLLRSGSLAIPLYPIEERAVGPSLGRDNIDKGVTALIVGMAGVFLFMAIYYKTFGLVADLVLLANVVLLTALLSMMLTSLMGSRALLTLMYGGRRKIARLSI